MTYKSSLDDTIRTPRASERSRENGQQGTTKCGSMGAMLQGSEQSCRQQRKEKRGKQREEKKKREKEKERGEKRKIRRKKRK